MNIETITKDNIKNINYNDVILIFFSESGVIGEAGRVDIFVKNKRIINGIKQIILL